VQNSITHSLQFLKLHTYKNQAISCQKSHTVFVTFLSCVYFMQSNSSTIYYFCFFCKSTPTAKDTYSVQRLLTQYHFSVNRIILKKAKYKLTWQRSTCKPNDRNYFIILQTVKIINTTIWNEKKLVITSPAHPQGILLRNICIR